MAEIEKWEGESSEYVILRFVFDPPDLNGKRSISPRLVVYAVSRFRGTREKNGKRYRLYEWSTSDDINEAHQFERAQDAKWRPKIVNEFKMAVLDGWIPQVVRVKETTEVTTEMIIIDPVEDAIDGLAEIARRLPG